jgi:hypothetical protein
MATPVDKAKFIELLKALNSNENAVRQKAETMYQQAKAGEPDSLMIGLMTVLSSADVDEAIRKHGAVLMRQLVMRGEQKDFVFARIQPQHQQQVAAELLNRFEQETALKVQKKIGEVVSKLAEYVCDKEDPRGSLAPGTCGWPALLPLVFRMADATSCTSVDSCESAMRLLRDVVPTLKDDIVAAKQQLGQILQLGLTHASVKVRTAALLLVCEVVTQTEKKAWLPLLQTAGILIQVLMQLAGANEEELLQESIQAFIDVATVEPDFFKNQLQQSLEPAKFMAGVARSREVSDSGLRGMAMEWLVTYLEKRTKWLTKNLQTYTPLVLQTCMDLMLELEDGEDDLKVWALRMDDEEGEEDADDLLHTGEEAIDRVAEAVQPVQMDALTGPLFQLIGHYTNQDQWQAKHAGLAAVKQTIEYIEDTSHVDQMADLLIKHLEHPHPRVRYTALHAMGQLANDQAPHFQETKHKIVMPILLQKMDDPVDRVAAMAMSAFVSFGEELDRALMLGYAQGFMQKLVSKLQATQHRGLREESITSIAVIAGVIEKDFSAYYDGIMPMLKQFVLHATSEKENRLRGKSFECMSLLGVAVGKEKFLPDARDAIAEMLKMDVAADDVQREYIKEATERICTCLKKDFLCFLPNVLPGIYKNLKLEDVGNLPGGQPGSVQEDDDETYVQVSTGEGGLVKVRTARFEEMTSSANLLHTFCTEMEGAFFDAVPSTAEALLPLLSTTDDMSYLCDEVRGIALRTWGLLIKSARQGATERSMPLDLAGQLLRTGLQKTFAVLEKNQDPESLAETAGSMVESIKNVGVGVLTDGEVPELANKLFALMEQSLVRIQAADTVRQKQQSEDAQVPREVNDEENDDDKDEEIETEKGLCNHYEECLGALMGANPQGFLQCLQVTADRIKVLISTKQHRVLALYLACDLLENLKAQSESTWPVFMEEAFRALGDTEQPEAATASAYAVNLAAPLPSFDRLAPEAFRRLVKIVGGPRPKKRDEKGKMAFDNAVAALLTLCAEKEQCCPPDVGAAAAWSLVVKGLPMKDDEDEAKKVHDKVVDLLMAQNQGLLGGAERQNLGKLLSILSEVHHDEKLCTKDTEEKIAKVFKMLPMDVLQACASFFTEKQQKKIEQIINSQ